MTRRSPWLLAAADAEGHADVDSEPVDVVTLEDEAVILRHDPDVVHAQAQPNAAAAQHVDAAAQLDREIGFRRAERVVRRGGLEICPANEKLTKPPDAAGGAAAHAEHVGVNLQPEALVFEGLVVSGDLTNDAQGVSLIHI